MPERKRPRFNLSVDQELLATLQGYLAHNRRKGRRNVAELTRNLWISYLRKQGVKLPALLKNGAKS